MERGKRQEIALEGAKQLAGEVDKANKEIERLADVLKGAKRKLSENEYPEKEVTELGGINIPFGGANLTGRGMGLFKKETVNLLINFAGGAQDANDQKDKLKNLLAGRREAIQDFLTQQKEPTVRWSVYVTNGPYGPWANMQPIPDPFLVKSDKKKDGKQYSWPEKFKIKDGGKEFELERYTKGEPTGSEPKIIPVDPASQGAVCPSDVLMTLVREIGNLEQTLRGEQTPGQEQVGLIETGRVLKDSLKEIGGPGA
jgi:hypothetical protein